MGFRAFALMFSYVIAKTHAKNLMGWPVDFKTATAVCPGADKYESLVLWWELLDTL